MNIFFGAAVGQTGPLLVQNNEMMSSFFRRSAIPEFFKLPIEFDKWFHEVLFFLKRRKYLISWKYLLFHINSLFPLLIFSYFFLGFSPKG